MLRFHTTERLSKMVKHNGVADIKDVAELNEVWNAWIPPSHATAPACGTANLGRAELKVEIIITAACS